MGSSPCPRCRDRTPEIPVAAVWSAPAPALVTAWDVAAEAEDWAEVLAAEGAAAEGLESGAEMVPEDAAVVVEPAALSVLSLLAMASSFRSGRLSCASPPRKGQVLHDLTLVESIPAYTFPVGKVSA